jgi:hypothetical protein
MDLTQTRPALEDPLRAGDGKQVAEEEGAATVLLDQASAEAGFR